MLFNYLHFTKESMPLLLNILPCANICHIT
jgi:hypothetical protein